MKWKLKKKIEDGEIQISYNGPIPPTTFLEILYYMINELRALQIYWGSLTSFWDNWADTSPYYLDLPSKYYPYSVEYHMQEDGKLVVLEIYEWTHNIAIIKFRVYK